ncbi:hypothetical protein Forpe1208_v009456 [Fusarium oxysporum f. sp. rapae]|uniref:Uncharacterized protein n=1 Tax=Fusarium oxysporum f. sp. rapae TaxID=485398 RepID=A0A8J5NUI8_FUSOX|nr:hypothetical protein Forpe1208_v009456 [Fusarium oxysporum f. sp. rapae]
MLPLRRLLQFSTCKVFVSSRNAEVVEESCTELNKLPDLTPGANAVAVPADAATVSEVYTLLAGVEMHIAYLDILLTNAGYGYAERIDTYPDE